MLKRSKNFELSACHEKSVVVTVDYIVTQKHVPVAKLGLNARSVQVDPRSYICTRVRGMWPVNIGGFPSIGGVPMTVNAPQFHDPLPSSEKTSMTGFLGHGDTIDLVCVLHLGA